MDVKEAILQRRSVRSYKDQDIPKEKLEDIMNSVRLAPSARNKQNWKFIIVTDKSVKDKLYEAAKKQDSVKEAPVIIAGVSTQPEVMSCEIPAGVVDVSIALDHLTLRAVEEGLGTCWIGAFDQGKAKEVLGVPEDCEIVALMTIGYPKSSGEKEKNRDELSEIISYDKYSE